MYIYSLTPPPRPREGTTADESAQRGRALFSTHCKGCHDNDAYGGKPVRAMKVGTDAAFANGGARGTGSYRPPALVNVAAAGPYFHHGAVPTLEDVLSPARREDSYAASPLGKGPVKGHEFGMELAKEQRADLVAFLRTL